MENQNGALGFRATLDIDDFNVSAQAMEKHIKKVSSTAISESSKMDDSLQSFAKNGAKYIVSYLVGQGMSSLVQSIVQVRGQFQQLEIAFGTMLKSEEKAQVLMGELVQTAAKTPFDLKGIAASAKQMMAYGSTAESVVGELTMLGNVAAGIGAPLSDIAYLYGTLRTQGRAYMMDIRQFAGRGIPIYEELAKLLGVSKDEVNSFVTAGKIGFAEIEQVFRNLTSSTGMYYNLMEKQSKSLTGMISNLEDAWDSALNKLGEDNQDLFAGAISGATYLVEHFEDILRIVKAVAIAYGGYKAAVVMNTLATKGYTGVALIDNTVRNAKIALLKLDASLTGKARAQTAAMAAAEREHTAALQAKLTAEERSNLITNLRIQTLNGLLTAEQRAYLSNLGLTAQNANYEAVAMGVLSVEQREALNKIDLSEKSAIYRAALEQEVVKKTQSTAATLTQMRTEVKEANVKLQTAKTNAILAQQNVENARYQLSLAQMSGNASSVALMQKKLEAAEENAALARKGALAASSDFYAKKKLLEATATSRSTVASVADTAAKGVQTATTSFLTGATIRLVGAMKALWAAMVANPLTFIITILTTVISMISLFKKKEEETTTVTGEYNASLEKELNNLRLLETILKNTEKGTKTHSDAISKTNEICKEYNKTLLDENSTLEQQALKYKELGDAIRSSVAEKVKAKYIEKAMIEQQEKQGAAFEKLTGSASKASHYGSWNGNTFKEDSTKIRNASGAVWDMVNAEAIANAEELKKLTGDAYTQSYAQVLKRITTMVQQSTGASEDEMRAFGGSLDVFLKSIVSAAQEADKEVNNVNQTVDKMLVGVEKQDATPTDYLSKSFSDLDKLVKDTQKEIDEINKKDVKVEADYTKLTELLAKLGEANTAIDTKTAGLNTEKALNDRIKQLKEERETVEINGTKYKELTKQIYDLERRLPGGEEMAAQMREKNLEAQRKVEEDRIAAMEDGYAKRKATLDFQHKQELEQIDKEEKELAKALKKNGGGGLTKAQKDGFDERRNLSTQNYNKANSALLDEEISYRKEQYELYYRWVEAMGEETANKQFAELLKGGNSYAAWVNQEIQRLEQKKAQNPDSFTRGDAETLFNLQTQQTAINGGKSAMERFSESINKTIDNTNTLAEKIAAIEQAKDDLAKGKFKLSPDETLEAQNQLDKMGKDAQEELNKSVLNDFKSYEEKKSAITAQYGALRLTEQAKNNKALLDRINKGEAEALSALNAEQLQASADWKNLFTNLDTLTASEIEKLISSIETQMANANLQLAPADYKALMESLNQAREKVVSLNPFKALGSAFDAYIVACKELKQAEEENLTGEQLQQKKKAVQSAAKVMVESISSINSAIETVGSVGADLASAFGNEDLANTFQGITGALGGAGMAAGGVAKIMAGDLVGGIKDCIKGIGQFINSLVGMGDAHHEKNIKALQEGVDELKDGYADLGEQIDNSYSTDKAKLLEQQNENLRQQNEKIQQQIREEQAKKKTDTDKIKEWQKEIDENDKEIANNSKYAIIEAIMGTDVQSAIGEFADAYAEMWAKGEKAAGKSADTVKKLIRGAIIEQLKERLQPEVEAFMSYLAEALKDGVISESEEAMLDEYQKRLEDKSDAYLSKNSKWVKDDSETKEDALSGAVRSMSEETGGIVAGRLNAIIINQSAQTENMRSQLLYQAEIAQNTRISASQLTEIKDTLKRIENKDSSLLSQGIS